MPYIQHKLAALIVAGILMLSMSGCFPGQFPVPEEKSKPVVSPKGNSSAAPYGSGAISPLIFDAGAGD